MRTCNSNISCVHNIHVYLCMYMYILSVLLLLFIVFYTFHAKTIYLVWTPYKLPHLAYWGLWCIYTSLANKGINITWKNISHCNLSTHIAIRAIRKFWMLVKVELISNMQPCFRIDTFFRDWGIACTCTLYVCTQTHTHTHTELQSCRVESYTCIRSSN